MVGRRPSKFLFEIQADLGKIVSNPKRLQILHLLEAGELPVSVIAEAIGAPPTNISQHLSVMRNTGVVRTRREGTTIYYSLVSPKVAEATRLHREALLEMIRSK